MSPHRINVHDIKNGQIVIYQRSDHKSGTWQVQLSIPSQKGYVLRSLGTKELDEAKRFAFDLWDELRAKVKTGGSLRTKSYQDAAAEHVRDLERQGKRTAKTVSDRLVPYSVRFFGKKPIDAIGTKDLAAYSDWRLQNGLKKAPCANTLKAERSAMLGVFKWAKDHSFLGSIPDITKPKGKDNRRSDFTKSEIQFLFAAMDGYVNARPNSRIRRDRAMLCDYVRFMTFSGVRVGEARNLTWKDMQERTLNGDQRLVLWVSGKTGPRETIPQPEAYAVLIEMKAKRVAEIGGKVDPDEPIFRNEEGKPVGSFKKGFQTLLEYAKLDEAASNKRRVIYSLRHSYATQMMADSTNLFYLAKNMGTSVEMLERFYGHVAGEDMAKALGKSTFGKIKKPKSPKAPGSKAVPPTTRPVRKGKLTLAYSR
jgi:integrase